MSEMYSVKDVAQIFGLRESRLRYWAQTGFINPSERRRKRWYYTFRDLIHVRAAKALLDAGISMQNVRKNLERLRDLLPHVDYPASTMRICSNGETLVARGDDDVVFEPLTGQLVMEFSVDELSAEVADVLALPTRMEFAETPQTDAVVRDERLLATLLLDEQQARAGTPSARGGERSFDRAEPSFDHAEPNEYRPVGDRDIAAYALAATPSNEQTVCTDDTGPSNAQADTPSRAVPSDSLASASPLAHTHSDAGDAQSAYELFKRGCSAEDSDDWDGAETWYRRAIAVQPSLSAAHTNLGNALHRRGDIAGARDAYERSLALEPAQPEARYNLGNVLHELGERDLAIAELERVCWTHPRFSDAHYNLGLMLAGVGGVSRAHAHLARYLELDTESEWAERARALLAVLT